MAHGSVLDLRTARVPHDLLGTTSPEEFFGLYWRRRFLHVPGGAVGLLGSMPSRAAVEELIDRPAHRPSDLVQFLSFPPAGTPVTTQWSVFTADAERRDPSEPVNLPDAERSFPSLEPLAAAFGRSFGAPASLQLFWAAPRSGLNPHRDTNDSFIVQIDGRKRWLGADVSGDRPATTGVGGATFESEPAVFDLEPGDLLYKPSHAPHSTTSIDEPTLSLTCSIVTRTAGDIAVDLLRDRLAENPAWLERLPLGAPGVSADDDVARRRIEDAVAGLAESLPTVEDLERMAKP